MSDNPWFRALLILLVAIASFYLFGLIWQLGTRFADVILLLFLAWLVAFILGPIAKFFAKNRFIPRFASVVIVYLALLLLLSAFGFLILPAAANQLYQLGSNLPEYFERTPLSLAQIQQWLDQRGIPLDISEIYQSQDAIHRAEMWGSAIAQNALVVAQSIITTVVGIIIILVLSFYIMLDGDRIYGELVRLVPDRYREDLEFINQSIDRTFGGYLRGALIVGVIYGIGTGLIMWWQQLGFILPVSTFAAAMMIIPFVGTFLAIIPPIIIAVFTGSVGKIIFITIALLVLQQIILHIVAPRVLSQNVGMHPLLVLLAILVGAKVAGLWGIIFGVPIVAVIWSVVLLLYQRAYLKRQVT